MDFIRLWKFRARLNKFLWFVHGALTHTRVLKKQQLATGNLMRLVALSCILLALAMTGLEATHTHSDAAVSGNSSPCAICISVHANAPTITFQLLPALATLETLAVPLRTEGKGIVKEISLFIRPPPAV